MVICLWSWVKFGNSKQKIELGINSKRDSDTPGSPVPTVADEP
jgi:hypothetical protein